KIGSGRWWGAGVGTRLGPRADAAGTRRAAGAEIRARRGEPAHARSLFAAGRRGRCGSADRAVPRPYRTVPGAVGWATQPQRAENGPRRAPPSPADGAASFATPIRDRPARGRPRPTQR